MRDAVICEPLRTPVGRYGGAFRDTDVIELAATAIRGLLDRCRLAGDEVDDVVLGQCYPNGEAPALGRVAALESGLPVDVPGLQLDRRCGSGLMAVVDAAMQVQTGAADLVIAGGAESMSRVELYTTSNRWEPEAEVELLDRLGRARVTAGGTRYPVPGGMVETAENVRRDYGITRAEQDELAVRSQERAVAAQRAGLFDDEIVPITVLRDGIETVVTTDEGPRAGTTFEKLQSLTPMMAATDPDATVTAGNACGQNDAAAVCIVTHPDRAAELGLRPIVRLAGWAVAGVPPRTMGIGPVPAVGKLLKRLDLRLDDMGLIELNEAFAAQVLACAKEWGFGERDFDRLNVLGSGISLGHPTGATGTRILATMTREMRRRGVRYGLETMCIGGGQGMAAVFETVA